MTRAALTVRREVDAAAFARRVEPWLLRREAEHNVLLGLLPKLADGRHEFDQPIYLASIERGAGVAGCAFRTPPYKLGVTRLPEGTAEPLVRSVASVYDTLPAILGREQDAVPVAEAWCRVKGGRWSLGMRQRIHSLDTLLEPSSSASGALRHPVASERALIVQWLDTFAAESGVGGSASEALASVLIDGGDMFVWDDGGAVAMVAVPGVTPHGARVGYVFTPTERRGRGYATAAVAALSRRLLAAGRRYCMLYTNVANPVSNAIYARLGYRPVVDVLDVDLST